MEREIELELVDSREIEDVINGTASPAAIRKFMKNFPDASSDNDTRISLREYGKPRNYGNVNHARPYMEAWPDLPDPSYMEIRPIGSLPYYKIHEYLEANGWKIVWQHSVYRTKEMERPNQVLYMSSSTGYMMDISLDYSVGNRKRKKHLKKVENITIPSTVDKCPTYQTTEGDIITVESAGLYTPTKNSEHWNAELVAGLLNEFEKWEVPGKTAEAEVSIIVVNSGEYSIRSFSLEDAFTQFDFPDLHYGEGFEGFHQELLNRVGDESKGLILFHGEPGTGKTQYIRHLLKELCSANKAILYSPPAVTAALAEPQMINFISDWIMDEMRDCILLIEDAEPLLESRGRGSDGRSTGISNLLNITDGLLNDILGLMVIATFNIDLQKIDPALLRPGRLVARKEFKKMSEAQAEKLAEALDIEKPDIEGGKYPITLAEFYNNRKSKTILTHEYSEETSTSRIGFRI